MPYHKIRTFSLKFSVKACRREDLSVNERNKGIYQFPEFELFQTKQTWSAEHSLSPSDTDVSERAFVNVLLWILGPR